MGKPKLRNFSKQNISPSIAGLLYGLALLFSPGSANAELADERAFLRVASAANFYPTLQVLAKTYQNETGISMQLSSGSSGKLYAQIIQGAPYDLFFSADTARPEQLETLGLSVPHSRVSYAVGRLILWNPKNTQLENKPSPENNNRSNAMTQTLDNLINVETFRFIALANPRHAPYGRAAKEVLQATGHWQTLQQNRQLVIGSNVTQVQQYIATGNSQLGFVALSQMLSDPQLLMTQKLLSKQELSKRGLLLIPEALYASIEQQAVALKRSDQQARALAFLNWITNSSSARDIIQARGYKVPALLPQVKPKS